MTLNVDLVEPFYGGSHQAWVDGWRAHSRHQIRTFTLPARSWRWRMRGSAITLAAEMVDADGPVDAIVASDMIDLADLITHTRRSHGGVAVVLYLHENQLTYPRQDGEALDAGLAWTTWRNLVAADQVWCNSAFHRDSLLAALPEFLNAVPDASHHHLLESVAMKMQILPVGIEPIEAVTKPIVGAPLVVSNQRWHHDNDVGAVVRALIRLADDGVAFRVAVVGDDGGGEADTIHPLLDRLGGRVVARGRQSQADYGRLLEEAHVVVSAARNEFFGIAVAEAVSAGAVPVLPNALAYPETIPAMYHETALYPAGGLRPRLQRVLVDLPASVAAVDGLAASMHRFAWTNVAPQYDEAIELACET
ncbi:MAG: glycosyltransferase involved in cell wall biosynthesis [Candidatus Aldehydirespiratoraceae bacterium]|jgi:glycosyltransferase involved in cell wall biosynthesis